MFALLVMKDYVDLFVTDYDNFAIKFFFLQDQNKNRK